MKISIATKRLPGRYTNLASGQIMAEACIGLSLMVLLWLLVTFTTYMANNRIRSAMAARDAAWLQSNGESLSTIPSRFYMNDDVSLATANAGTKISLDTRGVPTGPWSGSGWLNSVSFGMSAGGVSGTTRYPFVLLNMHVPFMPPTSLNGFLSVTSSCAWPADCDKTFDKMSDALLGSGVSTSF